MRAPPSGRQRLRAFRLADIPLDRRLRAARALSPRASRLPDLDVSGAQLLLARLRSDFWDAGGELDSTSYEGLREVALRPSDRVYWIPEQAWESVMGVAS